MFLVEGSFCFRFGIFEDWFVGASFCVLQKNGFFALLSFLGSHPIAMALPHPWQVHWCKAHSLIGFHSWAGSFCFLLKGLFVVGFGVFEGWFIGASFCLKPNNGFFALLIFLGYHPIAMALPHPWQVHWCQNGMIPLSWAGTFMFLVGGCFCFRFWDL